MYVPSDLNAQTHNRVIGHTARYAGFGSRKAVCAAGIACLAKACADPKASARGSNTAARGAICAAPAKAAFAGSA